jgi:hypothetical protein
MLIARRQPLTGAWCNNLTARTETVGGKVAHNNYSTSNLATSPMKRGNCHGVGY